MTRCSYPCSCHYCEYYTSYYGYFHFDDDDPYIAILNLIRDIGTVNAITILSSLFYPKHRTLNPKRP